MSKNVINNNKVVQIHFEDKSCQTVKMFQCIIQPRNGLIHNSAELKGVFPGSDIFISSPLFCVLVYNRVVVYRLFLTVSQRVLDVIKMIHGINLYVYPSLSFLCFIMVMIYYPCKIMIINKPYILLSLSLSVMNVAESLENY